MSFNQLLMKYLAHNFVVQHFLQYRYRNRLLLSLSLGFLCIISLQLSTVITNKISSITYAGIQKNSIMNRSEFNLHLIGSDIQPSLKTQILEFVECNKINSIAAFENNKYTFPELNMSLSLVNGNWVINDNNLSIQRRFLDEDFFHKIKVIEFFDKQKKNHLKCIVTDPKGLEIRALSSSIVSIDNNKMIASYNDLIAEDADKLLMILDFNKSITNKPKIKRVLKNDILAHIPYETEFSIRVLSKQDNGSQYIECNPFTFKYQERVNDRPDF